MKRVERAFGILTFAIAAWAIPSATTMAAATMGDMTVINPGDVKWGGAPPDIPKGAQMAVLSGDPSKPEPFVVRLKMPAGYKIAPHWHTQAENLTVISGAFYLGGGDKVDKASAYRLTAGGFHYLPATAHHYAYTNTATVLQIHGQGPFDITYVNPKDDPSKAAK